MTYHSPFSAFSSLALCLLAAVQLPAQAQTTGLETTTGQTVGVSLLSYKYEEPGLMNLKATKLGLDYAATYVFSSQWPKTNQALFVRGEFQYVNGKADYSSVSSGTKNDNEDWYYEVRGLLGRDYNMGSYVLAPYVGLGYRYLYHDLRGATSTGNVGYRRENTLTTAVLGVTHRTKLAQGALLVSNVEYMHVLKGKQDSKLSDTSAALNDLSLDQNKGYGLRLSSMWHSNRWSYGPTLTYWNIKESEAGRSGNSNWVEPKNETTEIGLKAAYHF